MPTFGMTELIIMIIAIVLYGIPIVAGIWAIVTFHRIHSGQKLIQNRLNEIESAIQNKLPQ